jgi:hypothetical protein
MGFQISRPGEVANAHRRETGSDDRKLDQTLDIEMALVSAESSVLFPGVGQIRGGTTFRVLEQLAEPYLADRASQRPIDQCQFVRARMLAKATGISEESLRRRISVFRRNVAELFQRNVDYH